MRSTKRRGLMRMSLFVLGGTLAAPSSSALAQMGMPGGGRSLGEYGASTIGSYYCSGSGGYLPYNGGASGFVPYRGGSGGGLGAEPIARRPAMSSIGGAGAMMSGTPIGGASLSGGMGTAGRGGMSVARPASRTPLVPFGYEGGIGSAGMSGLPMTRQAGMRSPSPATGPGFGSPFRVPPSPGGGASMTMP